MVIEDLCIECYEPVINPICEKCFLKQIKKWMDNLDISFELRKIVLRHVNELIKKESISETECFICGNSNLAICSYCFFLNVVRILRSLGFSKMIINDFLEIFNYRLNQGGFFI